MPLNKFIPLSPDPNITRDSDMGMAQFGHLNTIVDYLNTYVAADSLQLDGTGPLSTTLRAVTDAAGNLSPLKISTTAVQVVSPLRITTDDPSDMYLDCEDGSTNNRFNITRNTASQQVNLNFASNPIGSTTNVGAIRTYVDGVNLSEVMTFREDGNVGIGTTNPTARLRVISADTNGIAEFFQNGNTAAPLHLTRYGGNVPINLNTSGGTSTSPVPVGDNIQMSRITTNTYNGTAFGTSARIEVLSKGIQSATNYGSNMRFLVTAENSITTSEVLSILSSGNVQINESYVNDRNAKLFIKGSGSTSATTSLLVWNSSGTNLLKVADDGNVGIGTSTPTYKFMVSDNSANDGAVFFEKDLLGGQSDCYVYNKNASTNLTTGALIGTLSFGGYFNSNYSPGVQDVAAIFGFYTGTGTNRKGQLQFRTHDSSGMQSAMTINDTQLVGIGETSPTARLQIKGSGSTSATTSLLVQNSSGNNALKTTDDGNTELGNSSVTSTMLTLTSNNGSVSVQVAAGPTMQISGSLKALGSNIQVSDYFVGIRILLGNGSARLAASTTSWLDVQNVSGTSAAGNLSANLGTFGNTYAIIDASAQVEITSTTKGFLPPRMTTAQKNLIASPAAGLMVYDTDLNKLCVYTGAGWETITSV